MMLVYMMLMVLTVFRQDSSIDEILEFLDKAEAAGHKVSTLIGPQVDTGEGAHEDNSTHTVAFEARQLKNLFIKMHYH